MCLRKLLCSPGLGVKYLFLHIACKEDVQILQGVDSVLTRTEAKVRMVLLAVPGLTLDVEHHNVAHIHGLDGLLESLSADLDSAAQETRLFSASQESITLREMQLSGDALEEALLGTLQSFLPRLGRQEALTLNWIAFVTRPFSLQELDWAIAQDQVQQGKPEGPATDKLAASQLVTRLQVVLPGLLEVKSDNCVVLCISYSKVREILSQSPNSSLGEEWSPHLYLAQTCFGIFRDATALNEFARSFKVYAAQNWIHHHEMAKAPDKNQLALGKVLEYESAIKFWLTFVAYLALPPSHRPKDIIKKEPFQFSSPEWREFLDITNLDDLKTLFLLANRASPLPVAGRLLVDAAETSRQEILDAMSEDLPCGSAFRALAASQGAFHDKVREKVGLVEGQEFFRPRLPALVLGSPRERDKLVAELSSPSSAVWECHQWFADVMGAALEHDDKIVIEKALELDGWDAISGGDDSLTDLHCYNWSTLHTAAEHGNLEVIVKILETIHEDDIGDLPSGLRSPVFIAALHGFHLVVERLLSAGMFVDGTEEGSGRTALHIASSLGCHKTVDILLREGANVTAVDKAGDFPLHLAIRHGHARIAE